MSKHIEIVVSTNEVYEQVRLDSSYIGKKQADEKSGITFERVAAEEVNEDVFDRRLKEAVANLRQVFGHYYSSARNPYPPLSNVFALDMPDNCLDDLATQLTSAIKSYMSAYILSDWLRIVGHESYKQYGDDAASLISSVNKLVYKRKRPVMENPITNVTA